MKNSISEMSYQERVDFFHFNLLSLENRGWTAISQRSGELLLKRSQNISKDYWGIVLWHPSGGKVAILFDTKEVALYNEDNKTSSEAEGCARVMAQNIRKYEIINI